MTLAIATMVTVAVAAVLARAAVQATDAQRARIDAERLAYLRQVQARQVDR